MAKPQPDEASDEELINRRNAGDLIATFELDDAIQGRVYE